MLSAHTNPARQPTLQETHLAVPVLYAAIWVLHPAQSLACASAASARLDLAHLGLEGGDTLLALRGELLLLGLLLEDDSDVKPRGHDAAHNLVVARGNGALVVRVLAVRALGRVLVVRGHVLGVHVRVHGGVGDLGGEGVDAATVAGVALVSTSAASVNAEPSARPSGLTGDGGLGVDVHDDCV